MSDAYFIGAAVQVHDLQGQTFGTKMAMAASLNHTIYFHHPEAVRADEWMCSERESPWAGNDRALVIQRIWSSRGILVATCVQEVSISSTFSSPVDCLRCLCRLRWITDQSIPRDSCVSKCPPRRLNCEGSVFD